MSKSRNNSVQHQRTRHDHASERAEDYVEAVYEILEQREVCRLVDLASYFGVSHVTANRIVARLQKEGLLSTKPYQPICLTSKGKELAIRCRERHVIVYQFLLSLGVEPAIAAIDAEGIEHHVSQQTLARFKAFLVSQKP
ncbi:MAG TPA: manganese-binding transcriptional regulator MntR [Pirellulaceae bacterium]|nr:manganese-binding transcriptional regulator MntR [Pirellulaceae bacterium]HMO92021.1 manganese-binding transcriptional regulator MntR [Pirellulaceae bacterium]HMP68820.1 manganese-binding transcriptional regulator MntR [Pirellulaceae bacterium]